MTEVKLPGISQHLEQIAAERDAKDAELALQREQKLQKLESDLKTRARDYHLFKKITCT